MNSKLYIGNLDYDVTKDQLEELFSQVGKVVDSIVITDRTTGRSKGFGFVEMSNAKEAKKAVEKFNGEKLKDRTLVVNEARPKRTRDFQQER